MNEEKNVCPLSLVDWVNYLTLEQNRERYDYYNEEVSVLTSMIVLLTVLNCLLVLSTILFTFTFIDANSKNILYGGSWVVMVTIIMIIGYLILRKLPQLKTRMNKILNEEADIIQDILWGKETDIQKILERYGSIWKNKRNIL